MELGNFSVSLNVADLGKSKAFYEALGFTPVFGEQDQGWLILRNGATTIGLFHKMFDRNILTFNPGWNADAEPLAEFTDVREIQRMLRERGVEPADTVDESGSGPGSMMVIDPDGNPILIDQHV